MRAVVALLILCLLPNAAQAQWAWTEDCFVADDPEETVRICTDRFDMKNMRAPEQVRVHIRRGRALMALDLVPEALADFEAALRLDRDAIGLGNRAAAYRRLGAPDLAIEDYAAALELRPGDLWLMTGLAEAEAQAGNLEAAEAAYTALLESGLEFATFQKVALIRADLRCRMGDAEGSAADWVGAIRRESFLGTDLLELMMDAGFYDGLVITDFGEEQAAALAAWTEDGCPEP